MTEAQLIAAVSEVARGLTHAQVVLGIGDDAALVAPTAGKHIVACADTLNLGTHFLANQPAASIGHRALAVNLSDLAAMAATPRFALLSLSLPDLDQRWLSGFFDGFARLAKRFDVALIGGDTTRGPLSIAVTALGEVTPGGALRRGTSAPGDRIWVSGTLGGAALALAHPEAPQDRLLYPQPRVALGQALAGIASAAIDLSDGLRVDLPRLLGDGLGAVIDAMHLPVTAEVRAHEAGWRLAVAGGDDYELCFTAPETADDQVQRVAATGGIEVTPIGTVAADEPIILRRGDEITPFSAIDGFEHFG